MKNKLIIIFLITIFLTLGFCQEEGEEDPDESDEENIQSQQLPDQSVPDDENSQQDVENDEQSSQIDDEYSQFQQVTSQPSPSAPIQKLRSFIVYLTNQLRRRYNVKQLKLVPLLNKIAQYHSEDMQRRDYLSHKNPQGQYVGDRAKKFSYYGRIGQNIGLGPSLQIIQHGFENSPGHLKTATKQAWEEIGVGLVRNGSEYLVTVVFTPRDIGNNQLGNGQLKDYIPQLRDLIRQKNPSAQSYDQSLTKNIQQWLQQGRQGQLKQYLVEQGYPENTQVRNYYSAYENNFIKGLGRTDNFSVYGLKLKNFGVGLAQNGKLVQIAVAFY